MQPEGMSNLRKLSPYNSCIFHLKHCTNLSVASWTDELSVLMNNVSLSALLSSARTHFKTI